ncbi:TPA: DpnD/PcfM family protein [Streptococcus suis]|nr:DpnD/PcfM family protein [Streptococcus suis]HEM4990429.1 DpnD/PcfM family protein [Streptococcus suis]HEM5082680.1 DpnD/PcfM family protein [Streptococcus suis]HEM5148345.1 DpnD/PcfM family protein [Streptococcus suis]HEM5149414.1 DpnD/PcfM family protein [Streptococcus suis]
MRVYEIVFTETLSKIVKIEAKNCEEALQTAHDMCMSEEIILDASDFERYNYGLFMD